jgi:allene oxide cyclase
MRAFVPRRIMFVALAFVLVIGVAAWQPWVAPALAEETFTLIEHATTDTVMDHGDEGDSIGDTLAFSNELYDAENANVVGTSQGACTRTAPGKSWECTWTNILEDGSIVVQGPFYDAGDSTLAITGGSGKYSGASGEMQLKAREGGTEYEFTFEVN